MKLIFYFFIFNMLFFLGCNTLFNRNETIAFSHRFTTPKGEFTLVIGKGHFRKIADQEVLIQSHFCIYQNVGRNKVLKSKIKMDIDNVLLLKFKRLEANSVVLEDLNGDSIPEIVCRTIWESGSFPPFFIVGIDSSMTQMENVSCSYQIRYPVFFKEDKILSLSNGQIGINDTINYFRYNPANYNLDVINDTPVNENSSKIIFSEYNY